MALRWLAATVFVLTHKPIITLGADEAFDIFGATPGRFKSINAVTLATNNMAKSYAFYDELGLECTYGGPNASFSTFGSSGGPAHGDNSYHINIFASSTYEPPARGGWNGWGRAIFYVTDVD